MARRRARDFNLGSVVIQAGDWATVEGKEADDGRPPLRRFSMVAYSGGPMQPPGWPRPLVVDLSGLTGIDRSRPILKDHNRSLIVGHTESISVRDGQLVVEGVISGAGQVAQEIVASSLNGFPWQASIRATADKVEFLRRGKTAVVNGREVQGPIDIIRQARLGEISFVALGADDNTSAKVAASKEADMQFEQWLEDKGFDIEALKDEQVEALRELYDKAVSVSAVPAEAPVQQRDDDGVADMTEDVAARIRAELAAEAERVAAIRKLCAGRTDDIEVRAIRENWSPERTKLAIYEADTPNVSTVRTGAGEVAPAKALEAALCHSAGFSEQQLAKWYDEKTIERALSRELRGAGIHTVMYEVIRAAGGHAQPRRVDNEFIRTAFECERRLLQASSGVSTVSLTGILSNVQNKSLLAGFNRIESAVPAIASETDVNDFKEFTRYRLTTNGRFEKVGPGGELKHATLSEEEYKNKLDTYGVMIAITRQMLINDDLGALTQIPSDIGYLAALAREREVFSLLLSNPNGFFSASNGNLLTGADSELGITGLEKAEELFRSQKNANGDPILIRPMVLLVPPALVVRARQLFNDQFVNETTPTGKPKPNSNPFVGMFRPVDSPFLSDPNMPNSSTTAWYLFAAPSDLAAINVGYLRGRRLPTIENADLDFATLGIQVRGYWDFGVALQDHRAAVRSDGV